MQPACYKPQPLHKFRPHAHYLRARLAKLLIPNIKLLPDGVHVRLGVRLQQGVALPECGVIALQCVIISGPELAQLHVHKPPPFGRRALYQLQILRREHYRVQRAHKLARALCHKLIYEYLLAFAAFKLYLYRAAAAFRPNVHAHVSARKARAYQLRVLRRSVRTPEGAQKNSFHRVGLALRVLADDNVQAAVRAEQKRFIVAKVIQFQPLNKHTLFYHIPPVFINSVK